MAAVSLDRMTLVELGDLDRRIKMELIKAGERKNHIFKQRLDALIGEFELSITDVAALYGFKATRPSRKGRKVAIKYQNRDNPQHAWTGRGRQPLWLVAQLAAGRKIEDFLL